MSVCSAELFTDACTHPFDYTHTHALVHNTLRHCSFGLHNDSLLMQLDTQEEEFSDLDDDDGQFMLE